ncbi:RNA-binding protein [Bacteriovoracaceae bacterium]|nr:RNA-binding protein [Bacteriovoracaceae bacterium]
MFNKFGAVKSVRLITDSKSEQSKGIAFVEMPNSNAATEAIEKLNGAIFGGRTLKVSIAAEREEFKTPEFKKGPKTKVESEAEEILEAPKKRRKRKRDKGLKVLFNYLGTK